MPSVLFSPLRLREIEFKHRMFVSPMCQYSSLDGMPTHWHLVHLGSRAVGGAACVMQEATAVTPEGRISPYDAGLWNEAQCEAYKPIVRFIKLNDAVAGIQLAHAGRKASVSRPWEGNEGLNKEQGGWEVIAPSAVAFDGKYITPRMMTEEDMRAVVDAFVASAGHAFQAGYEVLELHAAHGYLLHEFLSPLSNKRTDGYGGSLENRMRLPLKVAAALRETWPGHLPMSVRISATDWAEGGWTIDQSTGFCEQLKTVGIDMIDVSSGGVVPQAKISPYPGYQVPFAAAIRRQVGIRCGAVGLITEAVQAEQIVASGQADVVLLARESLRDPYWPLHAAKTLGADIAWPKQYDRAKPR